MQQTGLSRNEIIGKNINSLTVLEKKKQFLGLFGKHNGNGRENFELSFYAKDNGRTDVIVTILPVKNQNESNKKYVALLNDITHYKKMYRDLKNNEKKIENIVTKLEEIKIAASVVIENEERQRKNSNPLCQKNILKANSNLTRSELVVAELVARGKTTKEIAESLCLSERTVSNHRQNIRRKMGLVRKKPIK